jgi:hypothetical protein
MRLMAGLALISTLALASDHDSQQLDWLVGCWVSPDKRAQEVWVVDGDHSLAGFAVTVSDNRVTFYEVLSIRQTERGSLVFTAHPSGQSPASFAATSITDHSVVFANPDHDYPQQIEYSRQENRLSAIISLLGGADPKTFAKVACE